MAVVKEKDTYDVLSQALALLERPGGWAKGEAVKTRFKGGKVVGHAFCSTAAVDVALGARSDSGGMMWDTFEWPERDRLRNLRIKALNVLGDCIPAPAQRRIDNYGSSLVEAFNDSTTKASVLKMFRCAVDQAKKDRAAARRAARKEQNRDQ